MPSLPVSGNIKMEPADCMATVSDTQLMQESYMTELDTVRDELMELAHTQEGVSDMDLSQCKLPRVIDHEDYQWVSRHHLMGEKGGKGKKTQKIKIVLKKKRDTKVGQRRHRASRETSITERMITSKRYPKITKKQKDGNNNIEEVNNSGIVYGYI